MSCRMHSPDGCFIDRLIYTYMLIRQSPWLLRHGVGNLRHGVGNLRHGSSERTLIFVPDGCITGNCDEQTLRMGASSNKRSRSGVT